MQVHLHPATERAGYSKEGRWIKNYIVPYLLYIIFELNLPSHLFIMHYLQILTSTGQSSLSATMVCVKRQPALLQRKSRRPVS